MEADTQIAPDRPAEPHVPDAQLLARQFTTDDPESLENLTLTVPATDESPAIEYAYDLTPPKSEQRRPYVRCSHCKYPNHWRGYVMRCRDGTRFLVGKDCGAKIYGADFGVVERRFSGQRIRQLYLRRLESVRAAFPALLRAVDEVLRDPALTQFEACCRELHDCLPDLSQQLSLAMNRRDGALSVSERVRDYAAEERRAEREKASDEELAKLTLTQRKKLRKANLLPKKDERPIYATFDQPVGRLAGGALFAAGVAPRLAVRECQDCLKAIRHDILERRSDEMTTPQLGTLMRKLGDIVDRLERQLEVLAAVPRFFESGNLATVANWANRTTTCHGEYRAQGGVLFGLLASGDDSDIRISAPAGYIVPHPNTLAVFRLALSG